MSLIKTTKKALYVVDRHKPITKQQQLKIFI